MVSSFPSFGPLAYLVVQAVGQVVFQCAAGYILSYSGTLSPGHQKFLSNINIQVFTPCLVFMKLASQLTPDKLATLALIPVMFVVQTLIAWGSATLLSRFLRLNSKQRNFVTAMSVFGNSNSLPVSLVISLAHTIPSLLWLDKFPNDKAGDVAARGILYLLIFQQLGQTLRWTWGFQVLLAPNQGQKPSYREIDEEQARDTNPTILGGEESDDDRNEAGLTVPLLSQQQNHGPYLSTQQNHQGTPISGHSSTATLCADGAAAAQRANQDPTIKDPEEPKSMIQVIQAKVSDAVAAKFELLPVGFQSVIRPIWSVLAKIGRVILNNMSPPLWALLCAMTVASIPYLRYTFFTPGTFVANTITPAIKSMSAVSVPLSLVVLGANICKVSKNNDGDAQGQIQLPTDEDYLDGAFTPESKAQRDRKLVVGAILGRMVVPTLVSVPLLMLVARYVPVSILQDPIFVVVCFLLVGAPTALQLSQICQINDVYMDVMGRVLMHGYVFWIMPSTLILVGLAMMTLEWM